MLYQWSVAPSTGVTFSASKEAKTDVEFANEGNYTVTVTVSDGKGGQGKDTVKFSVDNGDVSAPEFGVSIKAVTPVTLNAQGSAEVSLQASTENEPATGTTVYQWTSDGSNPGNVVFSSPNSEDTDAKFTTPGEYTLKLTATNGKPVSDDVDVVVNPADTTAPSVTIKQAAGQRDPATTGPIRFTATFSEEVKGFVSEDVTIGGSATATASLTGGPTTYTISVSGMTTGERITASINAAKVTDLAGNANGTSTSSDNEVTYNGP